MKDLEVMMQNLIASAFETVTTVEQGVEVLDVFMHLSSREVGTLDFPAAHLHRRGCKVYTGFLFNCFDLAGLFFAPHRYEFLFHSTSTLELFNLCSWLVKGQEKDYVIISV